MGLHMDVRLANLNLLLLEYFENTNAPKVFVESELQIEIFTNFMKHPREMRHKGKIIKNALDDLFSFYSILELASSVGYVGPRFPNSICSEAKKVLDHISIKDYIYKSNLNLVKAFQARLEGHPLIKIGKFSDYSDTFLRFLMIVPLLRDELLIVFLEYLDCEKRQLFLSLFDPVDKFFEKFSKSPTEEIDMAVHGYIHFLKYCRKLNNFLQSVVDPVLRSAFWHFHALIFQNLSNPVLQVTSSAIMRYRDSLPLKDSNELDDVEKEEISETHIIVESQLNVLSKLTSSLYRFHYENLLEQESKSRELQSPDNQFHIKIPDVSLIKYRTNILPFEVQAINNRRKLG